MHIPSICLWRGHMLLLCFFGCDLRRMFLSLAFIFLLTTLWFFIFWFLTTLWSLIFWPGMS